MVCNNYFCRSAWLVHSVGVCIPNSTSLSPDPYLRVAQNIVPDLPCQISAMLSHHSVIDESLERHKQIRIAFLHVSGVNERDSQFHSPF